MGKKIKNTISLADVANVIDTLKINVISDCKHLSDWQNAKGHLTPNCRSPNAGGDADSPTKK